ncbi:MAG: MBL fold metallo-hydrolase, partial [Sphingomonas sp.]
MRIHHLNCGTCCPAGGRLFDGYTPHGAAHLVCHCLLIETDAGLVLVDTGYGTRDVDHPHDRLADFFIALNRPRL